MASLPTVLETYRCLRSAIEPKYVGRDAVLPCVNPAHMDRHPSLRINPEKDVWRCDPCDAGGRSIALVMHSGTARTNAEALTWLSDAGFRQQIAAGGEVAPTTSIPEPKTYRYCDENGELLYTVERTAGKRFKQRRADGTPSLEGIPRVPYRLPELRAAIVDGKTIVVVEGEKDAFKVAQHGHATTTNSGGAAFKWPREWLEHFAGARRVVVIADCDGPGRKAAKERALFLSSVCSDVRMLDLDPNRDDGFDASAYLERKGPDALARAIENAPPFVAERAGRVVQLIPADAIVPAQTHYIVAPYIPRGEVTWLEGITKSGKTMIALDIIARITTGTPFVNGSPIERGSVAIITCEDDPARTLVPRLVAAGADRQRVSFIRASENGEGRQVSFVADLPAIESSLNAQRVSLVFVDGTFGILGVKDASSYTEAYEKMLPLVAMIRNLDVAALIVRHVRKSAGSALDKGIGSVGFGALGRSTLTVAVDSADPARRIFAHAGNNVGPIGDSYAFSIEEVAIPDFSHPVGRTSWGDRIDISADEAMALGDDGDERSLAEEFLSSILREPMTAAEVFALADKQRIPKRTLQRAGRRLGITIERRGFGNGSLWHPPSKDAAIVPTDAHSRHSRRAETPGVNGANEAETRWPSDRGKMCRQCKTIALGFDCGDGTFVCRAYSEDAA